jgi:hypothetical protein
VGPQHQEIAVLAIRSLQAFSSPGKIYVVTSARDFENFRHFKDSDPPLVLVDEDSLIEGVDLASLREYFALRKADAARSGWYFRQFLKMSICLVPDLAEYYLIWDSDTVLLKPLSFFDHSGRILVNPTQRYHRPYFEILEKMLNLARSADYSYISEHLMIRKGHMLELIRDIETLYPDEPWPITVLDNIETPMLGQSGFSEFETYGNYVHQKHGEDYAIRSLSSLRSGAKRAGSLPGSMDLLCFSRKYDYVSFEVWTRPVRRARVLWKLEAFLYGILMKVAGVFSDRFRLKVRSFHDLVNPSR